jgi:hypothetical protein
VTELMETGGLVVEGGRVICGCKGGGLINGEEVLVLYIRTKDGIGFGRCRSLYLQLAMDWSVSNGVYIGNGKDAK